LVEKIFNQTVLYRLAEKIFNRSVEKVKKFFIFTTKNKIEKS